jgi:transaldolase/glucose-6-phosphate isomerase
VCGGKAASVASFFVSRIDSAVDKPLDDEARATRTTRGKGAARGKVAIANAKLAYQEYKRLFSGARWERWPPRAPKPQRLLWASTGTKNKAYPDTLYVEELIGRDTVNTMPPATMDAFRDHGTPRDASRRISTAPKALADLEAAGISLDGDHADELVKDGVKLFADAADKLYGAVAAQARKCSTATARMSVEPGSCPRQGRRRRTEEWTLAQGAARSAPVGQATSLAVDRRGRRQMARLARHRGRPELADLPQLQAFAKR